MDATNASAQSLLEIYTHMVAGVLPLPEGVDPAQLVRTHAEEHLQCRSVHTYTAIEDGFVFYLACDSRALSSVSGFSTPLAAALPGHPNHQGEGAYHVQISPHHSAAIVRRARQLSLYANTTDVVQDTLEALQDEHLPRHDASTSQHVELASETWIHRQLANRIGSLTAIASLSTIAVCAAIIVVSNGVSGYLSKSHANDLAETAEKANALIAATPMIQPLAEQLNKVQALSYAAVSAGGWIDGYQFAHASGERYVISLPSWVTQDAIKALGDGVRTEAQPSGDLIWVLKSDSSGQNVKNRGPAPIPTVPGPRADVQAKSNSN
jgi:hypothetical protein